MKIYTNARVFTGNEWLHDSAVVVEDSTIKGIVSARVLPDGYEIVDLGGQMLVPGFVELQTYGGSRGFFVRDLDEASLQNTVESHRRGGVTSLMSTTNSTTFDRMLRAVSATKSYMASGQRGVLGIHIEGPYINTAKRGAHVASVIRVPNETELTTLIDACKGLITILTIAPETWPIERLDQLMASDIIVSVGHTNATYAQMSAFFEHYAHKNILATHLYNAMRGLEGREPGVVGAIFDNANVRASIIADGFHVDYAAIRIAKNMMGDRLFLISDAVGVHCEVERYDLGEFTAIFKGDHFVSENGTLAGSAITQVESLRYAVQRAHIPLDEALRMVSTYPAQCIGMGRQLGQIAADYQADMVVLNGDLEVLNVI